MAQKDTAGRILDAAEALFSEKGFAETSLRNITTKAGVNLAAVNYHFGSKKSLIQAVFARYLTPFSEQFSDQLDVIESQQNTPEQLLKLLIITLNRSGLEKPEKFGVFMRLLGLAYSQGQGHLRKFLTSEYGEVFNRYMKEVNRVTPELTPMERFWRIHFMLGATVFTLSGADALMAMAEHEFGISTDMGQVFDKLIPFLGAGLKA